MPELNRRDFLKVLAASFAALSAEGCDFRAPREKVVPYLDQTDAAAPGVSAWYASTCGACSAACGTLVKSRDGRPIKLEGNPDQPLSQGGLCARGQASVLDLYDSQRLRGPIAQGRPVAWPDFDRELSAALHAAASSGGKIVLLTGTLSGPSERAAAEAFARRYGAQRVAYDPLSSSAILEAHALTHGRRALPHYRFDLARAIVSFDADFMGAWISPVEFTRAWAKGRAPGKDMSWHAQFESRMSMTGANADLRVPLRPSQELAAVVALGRLVAKRLSWHGPLPAPIAGGLDREALEETARRLAQAGRGRALVVSASPDVAVQAAVNWLNELLGGYGSTLDLQAPSLQREGDDAAMERLIDELKAGKVAGLVVDRCNPAYEHPRAAELVSALARVKVFAAIADRLDETASLAGFAAPASHVLESWGDAQPVEGVFTLVQPLIRPLFDSRPALETLACLSGERESAYELVRKTWRSSVFARQRRFSSFEAFWDDSVQRGVVTVPAGAGRAAAFDVSGLAGLRPARAAAPAGSFELVAYPNVAIADGRQANNPWLQETPDPVTKATWGNYASFSPEDARRLGLEEGRVVRLSARGLQAELPAHVQPGQARGVVAAALGYGRTKAGAIAANYPVRKWLPIEQEPLSGADLYPFLTAQAVDVAVLDKTSPLAKTQTQDSLTDPILGQKRPLIREMALPVFLKDPGAVGDGEAEEAARDNLWPKHEYPGEKWALAVDINVCAGCAACEVACRAENNVPVVGKAEVRKNRSLQWLRLDRYYQDRPGQESPDVSTMPVMCQQCDNAPCETVCPVMATSHTSDGLNAQAYNRCVGTRYCENNCPYKARRFNWFDYSHEDQVQNLVLNPDVTVRTRGVVEKCTFCVQRINAARIEARADGRKLRDGDVMPACAQSCPSQAIVFGNINDPHSRVARLAKEARGYRILGELGVGPSVFYQAKVRNRET